MAGSTNLFSTDSPEPEPAVAFVQRCTSILGALAMSVLILVGIARAQKTSLPETPVPIEELRALAIEVPPPPPTEVSVQLPRPPAVIELERQPEENALKLSAVAAPRLQSKPKPQVGPPTLDMSEFRPRQDALEHDADHVFQPRDVDQRPVVLYRKTPQVSGSMLAGVARPRITLLFVVDVEGTVEGIRVLHAPSEELGDVVAEAVSEWRFRPAIRAGRAVRCIVQLPVFIRLSSGNPFSVN